MKGLVFIAAIMIAGSCLSNRNTAGKTYDVVNIDNEIFQLKNDTLYSSTGLKFYKGQQLIIGNPAGADGYFRSIIYKAAIVPSIWGQDKRYNHAIENHVNVKKSGEGVKRLLVPGKSVTIKGIGLSKTAKPHFYYVSLAADSDVFGCDIQFAFALKELALL